MEGRPNRRSIRLKNYDYTQNGYYFITICTYNHRNLFGEIVEATLCGRPNNPHEMIEQWLLALEDKFEGVSVCEYKIMPNHVHFIISKTQNDLGTPLKDIVGWFKTMTTNAYIAGVKAKRFMPFDKKVWQRNYYEHVIRDENDYLTKAEYILNNPLKWELAKETTEIHKK